jgi:uncharacterized membrane protein YqaE (UPF0057 family)
MEEKVKSQNESYDVVALILSIFLPPLGVAIKRGVDIQLFINIILTMFGWLPGIIHALYIILKDRVKNDT